MRIDFTGNGFLYNMVRIIAGTLLQAGYGQFTYDDIKQAMESRIRSNAGVTLPPNALFLQTWNMTTTSLYKEVIIYARVYIFLIFIL